MELNHPHKIPFELQIQIQALLFQKLNIKKILLVDSGNWPGSVHDTFVNAQDAFGELSSRARYSPQLMGYEASK